MNTPIVTTAQNFTLTAATITGDRIANSSPPSITSTILLAPTPASITATGPTSTTTSPIPTTDEKAFRVL
ncbi:hypothetical protein SprV_0100077900 [Sparganum proliferum]